jgi:hypothetical protein
MARKLHPPPVFLLETCVLVAPEQHDTAAAQAVVLARQGITQIVFSCPAMLALFRERRAALLAD